MKCSRDQFLVLNLPINDLENGTKCNVSKLADDMKIEERVHHDCKGI